MATNINDTIYTKNPNWLRPGESQQQWAQRTGGNLNQAIPADTLSNAMKPATLPNYTEPPVPPETITTPQSGTDPNAMPPWMSDYLNAPGPVNPEAEGQQATDQAAVDAANAATNAKQQDLINAQGELANYNAQLTGIANEVTQAGLKLREEGISAGAIGGRNIANERDAAIRSLPLQSLALLAQGKIATAQGNVQLAQQLATQAQAKLDQTFQIQRDYQQSLFNYQQQKRDAVFQYANQEQQNDLRQQEARDTQANADRVNNMEYAQKLALEAGQNGQWDLAARIAGINWSDKNAAQTLTNLTGQITNPVTTSGVGGGAGAGSVNVGGAISSITQSIIDNPNLFSSLTPTVKGNVISELQRNGYDTTNLGTKPLSDTAIKEINQTDYALTSLNDLKTQIQNNLQYIGPIKGLAALNPWSKARQVQATIDRVKQTVGKALEGGVLRKEDEEKYKKILATITDTPETATFKIDNLIASIMGNLADYKALQEQAGKTLNVKSSLQTKGSVGTGQTSTGNSYTVTKQP